MFKLMYNGVEPPKFLKILGVDQYLLPKIDHYNSKITGSYGNVDGGVTFGDKVFNVRYKIIYDGEHDDTFYIDEMALWLTGNNNKVSKFQLDDSGEYYLARVSEATDFSDSILFGEGTITFTASNPRRYAPTETVISLSTSGDTSISYTGFVPAKPLLQMVCPTGTTSVKVTNVETGDFVLVNSRSLKGTLIIDCNKKFVSLDGEKDMTLLNTESDWITLVRGNNTIKVTVEGTALTSATIRFTVAK